MKNKVEISPEAYVRLGRRLIELGITPEDAMCDAMVRGMIQGMVLVAVRNFATKETTWDVLPKGKSWRKTIASAIEAAHDEEEGDDGK